MVDDYVVIDDYTMDLVFKDDQYNASWIWNVGMGFGNCIFSEELVEAGGQDWHNHVGYGYGPFLVSDFAEDSSLDFVSNRDSYQSTTIVDGVEYICPFIDGIRTAMIFDEATRLSALRTGALDMAGNFSSVYDPVLRHQTPNYSQLELSSKEGYLGPST
jgi:peptide/nickel transport system substrate-binding protein